MRITKKEHILKIIVQWLYESNEYYFLVDQGRRDEGYAVMDGHFNIDDLAQQIADYCNKRGSEQ